MTENIPQNVLIVQVAGGGNRVILETLAGRGVRGMVAGDSKAVEARLSGTGPWGMVFVGMGKSRWTSDLIARLRSDQPELPVVAVGPEGDVPIAVDAMRLGASEYITYPIDRPALEALLDRVLPNHEVDLAAVAQENNCCLYRLAGASKPLLDTIRLARQVAPSTMPVLIAGESGTGKELLAWLLHQESNRRKNPYIRVNCAALSENLLESELFGHERGAFTGAYAQRKGRFELAHRGTLLLDEISETGPRLQAELLRVLEQQDFERVGGSESINVNVRVVCTSNRDLAEEVEAGRFRRDLYYRIRGVQLRMPPLRERPEDIAALTWHFVNLYAGETRRNITRLDDEMLQLFGRYDWPGNIRQLRNVIRTALVLGSGQTLSLDGAEQLQAELQTPGLTLSGAGDDGNSDGDDKNTLSLQDVERQAVLEALRQTNSHQAKAAQLLGISDRTLREKIRRYRRDGQLDLTGEEKWAAQRAS
ncbi:MAG: sigma-54 dependent transcriptional regulator [Phycisphaerae bacterium]|nr:sigma-54 dependent transcriptional regulator [Phycisphaerae bacterium]